MSKTSDRARKTSRGAKAYLETAHVLADLAGAAILPHFRKRLKIENKAKDGFDPVTVADTAAEHAMRRELGRRHPDHGIVGEEFGTAIGASDVNWVLDPVDGTRGFMMGFPLWGTLIGVLEGTTPIVGMMDQPYTRERFYAAGSGAFLRSPDGKTKRLKTRTCSSLGEATLACTTPDMFSKPQDKRRFDAVASRVRLTRFGGDCYAYCLLAAGHVDLVIEAGLKSVDIVALIPIIEQAGGVVTSWTGGPAIEGGSVIAAGDPELHATALALLSG